MNIKKNVIIIAVFTILILLAIFSKTTVQPSDPQDTTEMFSSTEAITEYEYLESDDFDWEDNEDDYETTEELESNQNNSFSTNNGNTIGTNPLLGNDSNNSSNSGSGNGGGILITSDDSSSGSTGNKSSSSKNTTQKKKEITSNPYKSYDEGYEDVYENDDYDWDRYMSDPDYAEGVDDAMDELDW